MMMVSNYFDNCDTWPDHFFRFIKTNECRYLNFDKKNQWWSSIILTIVILDDKNFDNVFEKT